MERLSRSNSLVSFASAASRTSTEAAKEQKPATVYVFRFQNHTHKDAKLLLLDPAPKPRHGNPSDPAALARFMKRHRHRLVVVIVRARRQKEVPLASTEVLCWGGFHHDSEVHERFCSATSLDYEAGRWITIGSEEMNNPENTWWTDIRLSGAKRVSKQLIDQFDCDTESSGYSGEEYDRDQDSVSSASSDGSFFVSSELDTSFRRPSTAEPGACGLDSTSTQLWRSEASTCFHSEEEPRPAHSPRQSLQTWKHQERVSPHAATSYEMGEEVLIYSSSQSVWLAGKVMKVLAGGTVRVRYDGAYQKEVPHDRQHALLRRPAPSPKQSALL